MTKLNDTMRILLSAAAQRETSSVLPIPRSLTASAQTAKAITHLLAAGFADERETSDPQAVHRTDADLRFGVFATVVGLAAIGIGDDGAPEAQPALPPAPAFSKKAAVITLLARDMGASVPELIAATGWLPHTTRAALTGLRKAGHVVERSRRDGATCYRIVAGV